MSRTRPLIPIKNRNSPFLMPPEMLTTRNVGVNGSKNVPFLIPKLHITSQEEINKSFSQKNTQRGEQMIEVFKGFFDE